MAAQPLNNWANGVPILPLDSGHKGDLDVWSNAAPALKNPKKDAKIHAEGVAATSAVGTVTASIAIAITLTGQQATSATGTVTVTAAAAITLTGQQASSATGTVIVTAEAATDLTGVEAIADVGSVEVTATEDATPEPALGGGGGSTTRLRKYWRSIRRRPAPARFDARLTLRGIEARGEVGQVRCQGNATVTASASARHAHALTTLSRCTAGAGAHIVPRGVAGTIRMSPPRVRAVRNPSEEDLMLTHLSLIE